MTSFLFAAALAVQTPAPDKPEAAAELSLVRPAGWTRTDNRENGVVSFAPPGLPPGVLCSVTVSPSQPFAGTAQDWHDGFWNGMTGGALPVAGVRSEPVGGFLRSWGEFVRPDGGRAWLCLYSALGQERGQAMLYAATPGEIFRQHQKAVNAMVQGCSFPGRIAVAAPVVTTFFDDSAHILITEKWDRKPAANGVILWVPQGLPEGRQCVFLVLPSEASTADPAAYHEAAIKATTHDAKSVRVEKTLERGGFKGTNLVVQTAQGEPRWISLYTARWGARGQSVVYLVDEESYYHLMMGWVEGALMHAYIPNPMLAPGAPVVPVVDVYFKADLEMGTTVDRNAPLVQPTRRLLVFYKNGLVLRVDAQSSGLIDSTYVAYGLASLDPDALLKDPANRRTGKWTEKDGAITIAWTTGPPETFRRNGDRLEGPKSWSRFKLADSIRLDGVFERKNQYASTWMIRLTKEGRFEYDGVNQAMGGKFTSPLMPEKASGTYEIRTGTLILRYDNGYRTSIAMMIDTDDPAAAKLLNLNWTAFDRVR